MSIIVPKYDELYDFLVSVDKDFPTPLSQKVDLAEYTAKLLEKSTISATAENGKIVSLVAAYTTTPQDNWVFIPVVVTEKSARGKGYAKKEILDILREPTNAVAFHLYTAETNIPAIRLYQSIGFERIDNDKAPRPNDVHLAYYLKGADNAN